MSRLSDSMRALLNGRHYATLATLNEDGSMHLTPVWVLRAGGSRLAHVIKVTIFLRDMSNFSKIVELRGRYFTAPYPADTIVEVTSLYSPDALIEIEAIAVADEAVERT
jgi:Endoribonuclease L-PSP/Pyridoxamine 5'-phosphate oxidase